MSTRAKHSSSGAVTGTASGKDLALFSGRGGRRAELPPAVRRDSFSDVPWYPQTVAEPC